MRDLVIGMAGSGGDGIVSAGESLIAACAAEGYHALMTKSFGSQIRGGESSCRVRLGVAPVLNPGGALDVAVALNWDDFLKFGSELPVAGNTVVVYDSATGIAPEKVEILRFGSDEIGETLRNQKIDAFMAVGPIDSRITLDAIASTTRAMRREKARRSASTLSVG